MGARLKLDTVLRDLLGSGNVYFQPPSNVLMKYPCIVYKFEGYSKIKADNHTYRRMERYSITLIDYNPDSMTAEKLDELALCDLDRTYTADNLNHWAFSIYI